MKSQDLLGVVLAISVTVIAVGIAFTGVIVYPQSTMIDDSMQNAQPVSRGTVLSQGVNVGGISNPVGESIEFEFMPENEINLDESNGFIRAKITYKGYLQQMGRITLDVISANTGEVIKTSEVQLDLINDDVWVTDIMQRFDKQDFIDSPEMLGTYILKISTAQGIQSGKAPFTVSMPSIKPIEIKTMKSSIAGTENIQASSNTKSIEQNIKINKDGFELSSLEPLLKDKIGKTYLTQILKEYYAKNITKEDFVHLKSFEDLDCSVTLQDTPNGEEINISCKLKAK